MTTGSQVTEEQRGSVEDYKFCEIHSNIIQVLSSTFQTLQQ